MPDITPTTKAKVWQAIIAYCNTDGAETAQEAFQIRILTAAREEMNRAGNNAYKSWDECRDNVRSYAKECWETIEEKSANHSLHLTTPGRNQ